MLKNLRVHNFKCFDDFVFNPNDRHVALIIGNNGSGKTTVGEILFTLRSIAQGENVVEKLIGPGNRFEKKEPKVIFDAVFALPAGEFRYVITFTTTINGLLMQVDHEELQVNGSIVFAKDSFGNVHIEGRTDSSFDPPDHCVLPLINNPNPDSYIETFKRYLRNYLFVKMWPLVMRGETEKDRVRLDIACGNFASWFLTAISEYPGVYAKTMEGVSRFVPELNALIFTPLGSESKRLFVRMGSGDNERMIPFAGLSDGEKCLLAMAALKAVNDEIAPVTCFWDEPDNFLSLSDVAAATAFLSSGFRKRGQLIVTSHNDEAILKFSAEDTFVFERESRLSSVVSPVRTLKQVMHEDLIDNDIRTSLRIGDIPS